jgi:ABC-type Fe3+-hydroxamate transport system substrate-binding protein
MLFTDQTERKIEIPFYPRHIISLVPSQTELLYDLGIEEKVIGITKFCVHPKKWFQTKTRVGGTKNLHLDIIRQLRPDLIIANKEENDQSQVEQLMKEFPVWVSDIKNLPDALNMIRQIGDITQTADKAIQIISTIRKNFQALSTFRESVSLPLNLPAAYFIWREPWMVAGGDTFINDMMNCCGVKNIYSHLNRYPTIELNELSTLGIQVAILSSEPYPFNAKHVKEIKQFIPDATILLADGEMFSWYGSRLTEAPDYFEKIIQQLIQ